MTKEKLETRLENAKANLAKIAITANIDELSDTAYSLRMMACELRALAEKLEDFQEDLVWAELSALQKNF